MALSSYGFFAEKILTTYYQGQRSDTSTFTLKHVAQLIADEIAYFATLNAIENGKAGETFYTNDTFITTYTNQAVQYDTDQLAYYVPLPAMPAALINNQEFDQVSPYGARKVQFVPIKNKDRAMQFSIGEIPNTILFYIENGRIYFDNPTSYSITAVNIKMVGSIPNGDLLSATLNLPKNYETLITDRVIEKLIKTSSRPRDVVENVGGEVDA